MYWVGHVSTLVFILATFAALIVAYLARSNDPAFWRPLELPRQLWLSTMLLLMCSTAIEAARWSLRQHGIKSYSVWLIRTACLGVAFIASQVLCWRVLLKSPVARVPWEDPNRGMFYLLTMAHALHVAGGMTVLGYLIWRVWHPWKDEAEIRRTTITFILATYWHFMAIIWLVLFGLFSWHQ